MQVFPVTPMDDGIFCLWVFTATSSSFFSSLLGFITFYSFLLLGFYIFCFLRGFSLHFAFVPFCFLELNPLILFCKLLVVFFGLSQLYSSNYIKYYSCERDFLPEYYHQQICVISTEAKFHWEALCHNQLCTSINLSIKNLGYAHDGNRAYAFVPTLKFDE